MPSFEGIDMTPSHPRESVRSRLPGAVAPAEARAGLGGEDAGAMLLEALRRSDRELRALAREQGAMRRVAALVAGDGAPDDLFALVAEEVAGLLDADGGRVVRFGTDGTAVVVGSWRAAGLPPVPPGAEVGLDGRGAISAVRAGGRIARVERLDPEGLMRSRAAAAIHVGKRPWGALAVASRGDRLPPEAEERLERFAEVVSLAVAGAEARRAMRASERRFRSLTTHAPLGIFEADRDGRCLFVNERWCELTGLTPGAAIGREWSQAIHPDDRERVVGAWRRSAAAGVEFAGEHRYLTPDGRISWVAERTVALHDEEGAPTGYMGTLTDVTERRRAEAAARRSARITRAVIEAVPAGISLIDPSGRVLLANGAMDRWDEERGSPAGRTIYERALASADLTADPAAYRASVEAIRTDAARETFDRYELVASGRSFERYTAPVRDGGGGPLGRLVVLREVTAEDRARRATDEFIALASHERR
jgi:PAS domain S-box-containing protein